MGYRDKADQRKYNQLREMTGGAKSKKETSDVGAAAEHFVISELLQRRLSVGGPYNQNGPHDLFVRVGTWRTVQVKVGRVNVKTRTIYPTAVKRDIKSDLIAYVDLRGKRIRWISNTDEPVPEELL